MNCINCTYRYVHPAAAAAELDHSTLTDQFNAVVPAAAGVVRPPPHIIAQQHDVVQAVQNNY